MTDHPAIAAGCTPEEIEAFERLTINVSDGISDAVLRRLADLGLIDFVARTDRNERGRPVRTLDPYVPVHHHFAFCSWAAEQFPEDPS